MQPFEATLAIIESEWLEHAPPAIAKVVRANPHGHFYAAAFWLFYADYIQIGCPALALNSKSHIAVHKNADGTEWSTRGVPAEWHWPVLDEACDAMKPH